MTLEMISIETRMLALVDSMEAPYVESGWRKKHCHYLKVNVVISSSLQVSLLLRMPSPANMSMKLQVSSTEIPLKIEECSSSIRITAIVQSS